MMRSMVEPSTYTLQIKRIISASPQRVFEAWTDPHVLTDWFAPDKAFTTIVHTVDLQVGGRYRIEMVDPSGKSHTAIGEYREVTPGVRLAFTWKWAEQAEMENTLVTLDFLSQGTSTELVLTHSLFVTTDGRDHHSKGWNGCLSRLAALVESTL